ncbi:MAG: hypothetical protein IKZ61_11650 [Prevotella sp.]|nr:hypothetical protein [Prevotella sp.]
MYYILTGVGIQTLFVHWSGCGRPQIAGWADEDTPLFVCGYLNLITFWHLGISQI